MKRRNQEYSLVLLDDLLSSGDVAVAPVRDRRVAFGVAGLGASLVGLCGSTVLMVGAMFPVLNPFPPPDQGPQVVAESTFRVAGATDVVARDMVAKLTEVVPAGVPGTEVTAGKSRLMPVPGTSCIKAPVTAVSQDSRAWSSGTGNAEGITMVVSAFGAGEGSRLMTQVAGAECTSAVDLKVTGTDAIRAKEKGNDVVLIRRGDLIIALVGTERSVSSEMAASVAEHMAKVIPAVGTCKNPDSPRSDFSRNPYVSPDTFTGLLADREVRSPKLLPQKVSDQDLPGTAEVTLPVQPQFPYWPLALPNPVPRPTKPVPPAAMMESKTIQVRVDDPEGPGCGWAFTGQVPPPFDQAAADQAAAAATEAAVKAIDTDAERYRKEAEVYNAAVPKYIDATVVWNQYAVQVAETATKWNAQRAAQERYARDVEEYNNAVRRYNDFVTRQAAANQNYQEQLALCAAQPQPEPTVEPTVAITHTRTQTRTQTQEPQPSVQPTSPAPVTPDVVPSVTATPEGFAPMQVVTCPPVRPAILDQAPPAIPDQPVPPADPRPEGER